MSAAATFMLDVFLKVGRVGLHRLAVLQEQKTFFADWHCAGKGVSIFKGRAQAPRNFADVDRPYRGKIGIDVVGETRGIAIDRHCASDITLGIPMCCQQAKNVALKF